MQLTRPGRPIAVGAALGGLVPPVTHWPFAGPFAVYVIWQAGFAVALAVSLPESP